MRPELQGSGDPSIPQSHGVRVGWVLVFVIVFVCLFFLKQVLLWELPASASHGWDCSHLCQHLAVCCVLLFPRIFMGFFVFCFLSLYVYLLKEKTQEETALMTSPLAVVLNFLLSAHLNYLHSLCLVKGGADASLGSAFQEIGQRTSKSSSLALFLQPSWEIHHLCPRVTRES